MLTDLNEIVKRGGLGYSESDQKEKLKVYLLIVECSDKRFNLLRIYPQLYELRQYIELLFPLFPSNI
jgi:hypothetical protein